MTNHNGIQIKNIYYMLAYAYKSLSEKDIRSFGSEQFENIHDMFAEIISTEMSMLLKRGLYRTYIPVQEELSCVRGKIDMPETIRGMIQNRKVVTCDFDEFSENNVFNQIIKTTILILIRQDTVNKARKTNLNKVCFFLEKVDTLEPRNINWNTLKIGRENQSYRYIISACYYVLDGLIINDEDGSNRLRDFLDDQKMHHLYEKFILEYYRYHYPVLSAYPLAIKWNLDNDDNLFLPKMQTDITLRYKGKTLIIDAKYYSHMMQQQFDKYSIHSGNLYQIFTYVKNYDINRTGNVAGMLLYAKTNEMIAPNQTYRMSGNTISVKTLDLNTEFRMISRQLNDIAVFYFEM